jgi:Tol biopolymer transport system component
LLYTLQAGGGPPEIWSSNGDGSDTRQLTTADEPGVLPAAAQGGRWFYYQHARDGMTIWRIDADGSDAKQLTAGGFEVRPVASPDGRWVYYTSVSDGQDRPMKMGADGGNVTRLTDTPFLVLDVTPDGTQLVGSARNPADRQTECALLPSSPGSVRPLGAIEGYVVSSCRASGNGDIAYVAYRDGHLNVFTRAFAGGSERQITHFADEQSQVFANAVSRDGRIALSRGSTATDIFLLQSDRPAGGKR